MFEKSVNSVVLAINRVCKLGGIAAGGAVILIMFIVNMEVALRYFFSAPTSWSLDMTVYLFLFSVFLAAGYTLNEEGHIRSDMIIDRLSPKIKTILYITTSILSLVFCGVLLWSACKLILFSYNSGVVTTGSVITPVYILQSAVALGAFLFGIQLVVKSGAPSQLSRLEEYTATKSAIF